MVELVEARVMNKKMLKKLKRHHGQRHGYGHEGEHHEGDVKLCGAVTPTGSEIVLVLRGKHHHHHHHHYHADRPSSIAKLHEVQEEGDCHSEHSHHRRGRHGRVGHRVMEGIRGLKHHVRRHHHHLYEQYCRGLGLDFQHYQHVGAHAVASPVMTPSAPDAELMMKNLSLAEDKEANKPI